MIELIVVIAVMGILASIAVPTYTGYIKRAKEKVCNSNCLQMGRMYEVYLVLEGIEHSDLVFEELLIENGKEICPDHGEITYVDGKVECSVHSMDDQDVPYL